MYSSVLGLDFVNLNTRFTVYDRSVVLSCVSFELHTLLSQSSEQSAVCFSALNSTLLSEMLCQVEPSVTLTVAQVSHLLLGIP